MRSRYRARIVGLAEVTLALAVGLGAPDEAAGQRRGGGEAAAAGTARANAPADQDLTGYWVSVVTEYWHLRMTVPPKGEYAMLPLSAEGRRVADAWDPAADQAAGNGCRGYGAAAIMRLPGRLHVHWADDDTLQVDIDSGTQTRLLRFGAAPASPGPPSWQGHSAASWESAASGRAADRPRYLKVTTSGMLPGYLRKNGVPYSGNAILEEHFYTFTEPNGDTWLVVTSIVTDPEFLTRPYAVANHFKKLADDSGWDPTPCRVDYPR